jgi:hypothetical protein
MLTIKLIAAEFAPERWSQIAADLELPAGAKETLYPLPYWNTLTDKTRKGRKMYKGTQEIKLTKNGLRYASVVNNPSLVIDQYGRVFETGGPKNKYGYDADGMRRVGGGYATH